MSIEILKFPKNSFIIDEEYGYRNHIWIDEQNNFDKSFNYSRLNWVSQIKDRFGGRIIKNVDVAFRTVQDGEWISLSPISDMPEDFDGKVIVVAKEEDGSEKYYDGTELSWLSIDLE